MLSKADFIELVSANKDKTIEEFVELIKKYKTKDGEKFTAQRISDRLRDYKLSGSFKRKIIGNTPLSRKKANKTRSDRLIKTDPTKTKGTVEFPFHHIRQIGGDVPLTTDDVATIKRRMNSVMSQYDDPLNRIADAISKNHKLALEAMNAKDEGLALDYMKRVDELNKNAESIVNKAIKELPKEYKNLIGFNQFTLPTNEYGLPIQNEPLIVKKVGGAQVTKGALPLTDLTLEQEKALRAQIKKDAQSGKNIGKLLSNYWCGKKVAAEGGRISFATGSGCPVEVKQKNFLRMTNEVATGKVTGEAAEQIAKNAGKVVAKVGSKSALASIFGPAGIGLDIAYEVGSIGVDVAGGKSWNRALQDNWITGAFISGTGQEEFHKELSAKYPEAKPYGQAQDLTVSYNNLAKKIERMKAETTYQGRAEAERELPGLERDLRGIEASYNALTKKGKIMEEGSPEYENYMATKTEFEDAAKAKSFASKQKLKFALDTPESDRFTPRYKPTGMKIDFNLPKGHTMDMAAPGAPMTTSFKPNLPTIEDLNKIWKDEGYKGTLPIDRAKEFITGEKWRQLFEQPGIKGTQDWRGATGGLAGLMKKYYD